jgi:ankyrin repeat protein
LARAAQHALGTEIVDALLAAGACPNARDDHGMTPLMAAIAAHAHPAVVPRLLRAGAAVNARGPDGATPFSIAVAVGRGAHVLGALRAAGATAPPESA